MFTWLAVAGLASACAPTRVDLPGTLAIDPRFTPEQAESVLQAAEQWRVATGGRADLSPVVGDQAAVRVRAEPADGALADTTLDASGGALMRIAIDHMPGEARHYHESVERTLLDTALHELGHAFGLDHEPGGVMRAEGFGGACVDQRSVERFCAEYGCGAQARSTCP